MERVLTPIAAAATFIGMGAVIIAQGVLDPGAVIWERLVGGSVLVAAAVLIVRWTFRLLKEVRIEATEDRQAWLEDRKALVDQLKAAQQMLRDERNAWADERKDILEQLGKARELLATITANLETERALRLSLEQKGIVDRRSGS